MKKRITIFSLVLLLILFITGCDTNQGLTNYNTTPEDGIDTPQVISRTPSLMEIANTFKDNDPTLMIDALKESVSKLSMIELTDGINFLSVIIQVYGNDSLIKTSEKTIFDNASEVALLSSYCATDDALGPILIIKNAEINNGDGTSYIANVVLLGGTELKSGQATGLLTDLYAGMELTNEFLYDAYYAIYDNLKGTENVPLIIGGISLGGMVAQQLAALPALNNYFNVKNIIASGSPIISPDEINYSKTTVNRLIASEDLVPKLSIGYNGVYNSAYGTSNAGIVRNTGYKTFIGAHALGYVQKDFWNGVDALGYENGKHTMSFEKANMTWYDAPTYNSAL